MSFIVLATYINITLATSDHLMHSLWASWWWFFFILPDFRMTFFHGYYIYLKTFDIYLPGLTSWWFFNPLLLLSSLENKICTIFVITSSHLPPPTKKGAFFFWDPVSRDILQIHILSIWYIVLSHGFCGIVYHWPLLCHRSTIKMVLI